LEPSHLPIDLVRTYPAEGMKAWRVAKLEGNGPHLLEPTSESSESHTKQGPLDLQPPSQKL